MVRTNQGGSVLSFVVIGAVVISLLIGGVYYVRRQLDTSAAESSQPEPQGAEKSQPEKPAEKSPEKQTQEKRSQSGQQQSTSPPSASKATDDAELPQTGPAELVATLVALGLLSATTASYVRSRRPGLSL